MKKKILALVCLLMCLFGVKALADGMQSAAKDRIRPGLPPGMVATWVTTPGAIDILIDTDKTDWDTVAAAATKSGSLVIHPGMTAPAGALGEVAVRDYNRYDYPSVEASENSVLQQV